MVGDAVLFHTEHVVIGLHDVVHESRVAVEVRERILLREVARRVLTKGVDKAVLELPLQWRGFGILGAVCRVWSWLVLVRVLRRIEIALHVVQVAFEKAVDMIALCHVLVLF